MRWNDLPINGEARLLEQSADALFVLSTQGFQGNLNIYNVLKHH